MSDYDFDEIIDFDGGDEGSAPVSLEEESEEKYKDISVSAAFSSEDFSPITAEDIESAQEDGFDSFNEIDFEDDSDMINVVREEDVRCRLNTSESNDAPEKKAKVKKIIIGIKEWVVELIHEGANIADIAERTGSDKKAAREYTKVAEMPKITFAPPAKKMSFGKKLVIFLIACVAVGIFFGVEANSYFWYKNGIVESSFACAWSWIMIENLPTVMSPIQSDAFMAGFFLGFGILGIIGLFIWLDSDAKKHSRVGHEHGNARLGTKRDFTIYKRKFMD